MQIILYESGQNDPSAFVPSQTKVTAEPVVIPIKKGLSNIGRFFKGAGYGLAVISLVLLFLTAAPVIFEELSYRFTPPETTAAPRMSFKEVLENEKASRLRLAAQEAESYGVGTDFSIAIPKIGAAAKIIPNVNPADEKEYKEALKQGVAHSAGTGFPGGNENIYLFAHSTNNLANVERFNAIFYQLKELEAEDKIIVFFAGQKFTYLVTERLITEADDIKWINENDGTERLILQTCWPPGTSLKRLIVIAKPI